MLCSGMRETLFLHPPVTISGGSMFDSIIEEIVRRLRRASAQCKPQSPLGNRLRVRLRHCYWLWYSHDPMVPHRPGTNHGYKTGGTSQGSAPWLHPYGLTVPGSACFWVGAATGNDLSTRASCGSVPGQVWLYGSLVFMLCSLMRKF